MIFDGGYLYSLSLDPTNANIRHLKGYIYQENMHVKTSFPLLK